MALIKKTELIPDDKNFNLGNEAGGAMIANSFKKFGAGRSILIDKNNKIIAGNKSTENFEGEDVIVIESDGSQLIAVKRTDIDLDTPEGREMALADNATAKANIVWAEDVIASELGVEVAEAWGVEMITTDGLGDDFSLKDGDKSPFQQMTFTLSDEQAERIKEALKDVDIQDGTQYGNENSNGNALHQIVLEWAEQKILS